MPGRTYSATGTEPSSLIIPWGGINGYSGGELLTNCADNFTIELWVKTGGETHEIDQLYATGGGTSGQRYVIDPPQGLYYNNSYDDAGVGISVGTNGVSIYEHNYGYMPAVLIWEGTVVDWTHIALVYENKIPRLYINGNLVGTGTASPKTHVYPGTLLGSGVFGTMNGWIDEARIWSTVRTQQQIQENMNKSVATPQSNLEAYWPIQTGETTNLQDISGNNHTVVLPPGNNYGSYTNDGGSTAPLSGDYYYCYGFNGKENDNEVKGAGNQLDYGMRIYDPRLGRFLSVDPLNKSFPWFSPYQFAGNTPIAAIDIDGKEQKIMINWYDQSGNLTATKIVKNDHKNIFKLYQSLSKGLNFGTTYELEGTKFNATNANFSDGFEAYQKGDLVPRLGNAKTNPRGGVLTFSIYHFGKNDESVNISYANSGVNQKELTADLLRGVSDLTGMIGDAVEFGGYGVSLIPGGQGLGITLIGTGKAIGKASLIADVSADLLEGKTKNALVKLGVEVVVGKATKGLNKLPLDKALDKNGQKITKEALDTYFSRGIETIRDGYIDSQPQKVEESNNLDLKIKSE